MPGRDLDQGRNSLSLRDPQRLQTIARPTVKKVVAPGFEMTRRDPIQIFLLCSIIISAIEKREQPDRMPAERLNEARRNLLLPIVVSDRFAEKLGAIRGAQGFE